MPEKKFCHGDRSSEPKHFRERSIAWAILQIVGLDVGPQELVELGPGAGPKSGQFEEDVVGDDVD
jgi:hypothetical protein